MNIISKLNTLKKATTDYFEKHMLIIEKRSMLLLITIIIIFSFISFFFFDYLSSYFYGKTDSPKGEFLKLILTTIGGLFVLYGLYLNLRRTKALDKQNTINDKGKTDERFKSAIEHLGSNNSAIILGGVHALHQIAKEANHYREPVFNILCSFIKETTKKTPQNIIEKPSTIIQTIIDVLFKNKDTEEYIFDGLIADLSGSNFNHADFSRSNLKSANLSNGFFVNVSFCKANLSNAIIKKSNFSSSEFSDATINDIHIVDSIFNKTSFLNIKKLQRINLIHSSFNGSSFRNTIFLNSKIHDSNFYDVIFNDTVFMDCTILKSNFIGSDFTRANFYGTRLDTVYFQGVDFELCHFYGSNIEKCNFDGSLMKNTDFYGCGVDRLSALGVDLNKAFFYSIMSNTYFLGIIEMLSKALCNATCDVSSIRQGVMLDKNYTKLVEDFSLKINDSNKIDKINDRLSKASIEGGSISEINKSILSQDIVDSIINDYNRIIKESNA
jgi:uncharacterized protein YjbI with pentapeptide repeats